MELARLVEHRHLASSADAGVDRKHALLAKRRSKQEMAQVLREHLHRRAVRLHFLLRGYVDLAGRREQALVGVLGGKAHVVHDILRRSRGDRPTGCRIVNTPFVVDDLEYLLDHRLLLHHEMAPQHAFLLPAADGEVAVAGNLGNRFLEIVVLLELRGLGGLWRHDLALHDGLLGVRLAHEAAHLCHVGDALG